MPRVKTTAKNKAQNSGQNAGDYANKPLLIVESPAKAKTIYNYLGGQFNVLATMGHLIDLPKNRLGIDVQHGYAQEFVRIKGKGQLINKIKRAVQQAPKVYLAQDPDREGEAIAWQVIYLANGGKLSTASKPKKSTKNKSLKSASSNNASNMATTTYKLSELYPNDPKFARIVFHEITKQAIEQAIQNPSKLNVDLVEAQKARRALDRLVGYPLSELLWHKIRYGLSAGRVQSAALRLIVERQQEIDNFVPEIFYYFGILTDILPFYLVNPKTLAKKALTKDQVELLKKQLAGIKQVAIKAIQQKIEKSNPPAPFTTSTLQQMANKLYGFSAKTTMRIAQELYQGMDIPGLGRKALITYMRTDSVQLSDLAIDTARKYIKEKLGQEYLNPMPRKYKTKAKLAQEAHEAIRPVYLDIEPSQLKGKIPETHFKLYSLIWKRTLATQMKPAEYTIISASLDLMPQTGNKEIDANIFAVKEKFLSFEGYLKVYGKVAGAIEAEVNKSENADTNNKSGENTQKQLNLQKLQNLKQGQKLNVSKLDVQEFQTKPKPQYTDATLVKTLEKLGIGRPSTFATIIDTLIKRGYAERQGKYLVPTDTGKLVLQFLLEHFPNIVDYNFTAQMEDNLDKIAQGKLDKISFLNDFYPSFIKQIQEKEDSVQKQDLVVLEKTDKTCPKCGAPMVLKLGRYGKFYSCSRFPECDGMLPYIDEDKYIIPDKAKTGEWVLRVGPYGRFWAHKDYPKVKETSPLLLKEKCPKCGSPLVERKGKNGRIFIACSGYPKCRYVKR